MSGPSPAGDSRLIPPLFVFEGDDLLVFTSDDEAVAAIEPVDARDAGYEAFDAEGAVIEVRGIGIQAAGRVVRTVSEGTTVLRPTGESDPARLRQKLVGHIEAVGTRRYGLTKAGLVDVDLAALVAAVAERHVAGS
jgi:hypothetical protein